MYKGNCHRGQLYLINPSRSETDGTIHGNRLNVEHDDLLRRANAETEAAAHSRIAVPKHKMKGRYLAYG